MPLETAAAEIVLERERAFAADASFLMKQKTAHGSYILRFGAPKAPPEGPQSRIWDPRGAPRRPQ